MLKFNLIYLILCLIGTGITADFSELEPSSIPIEVDDDDVIQTQYGKTLGRNVYTIVDEGIRASDPLNVDNVEVKLPTLRYSVSNVSIASLQQCTLRKVTMDPKAMKGVVNFFCPSMTMSGQYKVSGLLLILPIEGKGDFKIDAKNYGLIVNAGLQKFKDNDGQTHLKVKNFVVKLDAEGPIKYNLTNLFNGNTKLSEAAHKFANNNWRPVTALIHNEFMSPALKTVMINVNKILKPIPFEDLTF